MKKVIVMIRTSTETQQVEDQHREMVSFCKEQGYGEDQMVIVETQGASAAKVDDEYMKMIDRVKEYIVSDPDIDCFAVWHLNRALRNERVYVDLKEFLVEHRVQFLVKNPYLKLLNEDGSVNMGMELAFSLMATLAKQDNDERKAKFKRAKDSMRQQGKFIGGRCAKTGYRVDDRGYIVIDEEKGALVKEIFSMYATGKYSVRTLWEELSARGEDISYHLVNRMISDTSYIDGIYPPMISEELWSKVEEVRKKNYLSIPKGKKHCFGSGIFKCPECGHNMIAEGHQYRCWHHNKYSAPPHCGNGLTIRVENMDFILWYVAEKEEVKWRMKMDSDKESEYREKMEVLGRKKETAERKLSSLTGKKDRIVETYQMGLIDKEKLENGLRSVREEEKGYKDTILSLTEQIEGVLQLLEGIGEEGLSPDWMKSVYEGVISEENLQIMDEIVHRHIKRVTCTPEWYGKERDKRAERQNAQLVTVELTTGEVRRYIYVARKYKGHRWGIYRADGKEIPVLGERKIVRESCGSIHPRAFKKIKDL